MGRDVEPILALDALRPLCFVVGVDTRLIRVNSVLLATWIPSGSPVFAVSRLGGRGVPEPAATVIWRVATLVATHRRVFALEDRCCRFRMRMDLDFAQRQRLLETISIPGWRKRQKMEKSLRTTLKETHDSLDSKPET